MALATFGRMGINLCKGEAATEYFFEKEHIIAIIVEVIALALLAGASYYLLQNSGQFMSNQIMSTHVAKILTYASAGTLGGGILLAGGLKLIEKCYDVQFA